MKLSPALQALASPAVGSPTTLRCVAGNFRWELAVGDERAAEYTAYVGDVASHKEWKAEHWGYVRSFVHVPKDLPRSAECFARVNGQAHLDEHLDNTLLLRLESLDPLFDQPLVADLADAFWQRFFKSQRDLIKDRLSDPDESLRTEFVNQWNAQRTQARPMFATFLNEFGGDLKQLVKTDWPHILRDRLGVTHLPSTAGKPLPVALMCYTLDEVRQARALATRKGAVSSFSRPTVLDSEMSAAFIPAPLLSENRSFGYTLDLAGVAIPDAFTPELLTFPIDYQARHIKALGLISREHGLAGDDDILAARNRHVQGLRRLPGCGDFGEVLA